MRVLSFVRLRAALALMLMCGLMIAILVSSCGRVAPSYEPGTITVTSTPAGAAIFIDNTNTGEITPFSFEELVANRYEIAVELDGFFADPVSSTVDLTPAANVTRDFILNSQAPTLLTVTSDPAGAEIFINGSTTGEVTPATLSGLDAGDNLVSLELAGKYIAPANFTVNVVAHETTVLPVETFAFRSKKVVMMEGFSNVDCAGCPELANNVEALMHTPGYGLDQVLYCKFSMFWPGINDPHYQYNTAENTDRQEYYVTFFGGIPVLSIQGAKVTGTGEGNTPTAGEMEVLLTEALDDVPGFLIDISADFTNSDVTLETTITAIEDVNLSGHTLYIALVQDFLEYDEAPGSENETIFHWLFRDRVDTLPTLSNLTAGQVLTFNESLIRAEWDLETLHVIAFVQEDASKTIKQAGISSTNLPSPAPASKFLNNPKSNSIPGEIRP